MSHDTFPQKSTEKTEKEKKTAVSPACQETRRSRRCRSRKHPGLFHPELRGKGDGLAGSNKNRQVEGVKGCREHIGGIPDRDSDYLL